MSYVGEIIGNFQSVGVVVFMSLNVLDRISDIILSRRNLFDFL